MRLQRAIVMACCFNESVAASSDHDVRRVSRLACQRRFGVGENSRGMAVRLRVNQRPLGGLIFELKLACLVRKSQTLRR